MEGLIKCLLTTEQLVPNLETEIRIDVNESTCLEGLLPEKYETEHRLIMYHPKTNIRLVIVEKNAITRLLTMTKYPNPEECEIVIKKERLKNKLSSSTKIVQSYEIPVNLTKEEIVRYMEELKTFFCRFVKRQRWTDENCVVTSLNTAKESKYENLIDAIADLKRSTQEFHHYKIRKNIEIESIPERVVQSTTQEELYGIMNQTQKKLAKNTDDFISIESSQTFWSGWSFYNRFLPSLVILSKRDKMLVSHESLTNPFHPEGSSPQVVFETFKGNNIILPPNVKLSDILCRCKWDDASQAAQIAMKQASYIFNIFCSVYGKMMGKLQADQLFPPYVDHIFSRKPYMQIPELSKVTGIMARYYYPAYESIRSIRPSDLTKLIPFNYQLLLKGDGERVICWIANTETLLLFDNRLNPKIYHGQIDPHIVGTVLDAELCDRQILLCFDILKLGEQDVRKYPYLTQEDTPLTRRNLLNDIILDIQTAFCKMIDIRIMPIISSSRPNNWLDFKIDGLVLNPGHSGYPIKPFVDLKMTHKEQSFYVKNLLGKECVDRNIQHTLKWKPVQNLTIDFIVKPKGSLYVGIRLNDTYTLTHFCPSNPWLNHLVLTDDINTDQVYECRFEGDIDKTSAWSVVKKREDKTEAYQRSIDSQHKSVVAGQDVNVAEWILYGIFLPIDISDLFSDPQPVVQKESCNIPECFIPAFVDGLEIDYFYHGKDQDHDSIHLFGWLNYPNEFRWLTQTSQCKIKFVNIKSIDSVLYHPSIGKELFYQFEQGHFQTRFRNWNSSDSNSNVYFTPFGISQTGSFPSFCSEYADNYIFGYEFSWPLIKQFCQTYHTSCISLQNGEIFIDIDPALIENDEQRKVIPIDLIVNQQSRSIFAVNFDQLWKDNREILCESEPLSDFVIVFSWKIQ